MSLTDVLLDDRGHHFACHRYHKDTPSAEGSHADLFCECHSFNEPMVLSNGTDVAWPARWDADLAAAWRRDNKLESPIPSLSETARG